MYPWRKEWPPPYSEALVRKILAEAAANNATVPEDTLWWLVAHPTEVVITEAIRDAWSRSNLPLRQWAPRIERVHAWVAEDAWDFGLEVQVRDLDMEHVVQEAPMSEETLRAELPKFGGGVPDIMIDLARTAPGICLTMSTARWADPHCFHKIPGGVRSWCDSVSSDDPALRSPDPMYADYVMEVGTDGQGGIFVQGRDGSLFFFDHETHEFTQCKPRLEQVIHRYFEDPDCVYDRDWMGV